jgi:hypothetical protein
LDAAALHLAFYLASWGMYRGSTFLLQCDFTVHRPAVDLLFQREFSVLWNGLPVDGEVDEFAASLLELRGRLRDTYEPAANLCGAMPPTDTLVSKILLGTTGCIPAVDSLFVKGWRSSGMPIHGMSKKFVALLQSFLRANKGVIEEQQNRIRSQRGVDYPVAKVVDMHFWQLGFDAK